MGAHISRARAYNHPQQRIQQSPQDELDCLSLLLIGLSGSGKTTLYNQFHILHQEHNRGSKYCRRLSLSPPTESTSRFQLKRKSTSSILSQQQQKSAITGPSFTDRQRAVYASLIRSQCVSDFCCLLREAMRLSLLSPDMVETARVLIDALEPATIAAVNNESENNNDQNSTAARESGHHDTLLEMEDSTQYQLGLKILSHKVRATMIALWHSEALQITYGDLKRQYVMDSTQHFLDRLEEIAKPEYLPTDQDILLNHNHTLRPSCATYSSGGIKFRLIDVGGQVEQWSSWAQQLEISDAIVFVVALDQYDENFVEGDADSNKLLTALSLFERVVKHPSLRQTSVILVMNKKDLFEEKMKTVGGLQSCFPDYSGGDRDCRKALRFISSKFQSKTCASSQAFFSHSTSAIVSVDLLPVLNTVHQFVLCQNVLDAGFL